MQRDLIDILRASNGDITERGLRSVGCTYDMCRCVVKRLDALGLTQRVGAYRQRELIAPLAEIMDRLDGEQITAIRVLHRPHRVPRSDLMRIVHDPGELFAPGAVFPADQVLPRRYAPDDPDQWYIGTLFERRRIGCPHKLYIYDGERVREKTIDD